MYFLYFYKEASIYVFIHLGYSFDTFVNVYVNDNHFTHFMNGRIVIIMVYDFTLLKSFSGIPYNLQVVIKNYSC